MTSSRLTNKLAGAAIALAGVLVSLAGCTKSEPTGTLQGTVTLDGQPFSGAQLNLVSKETGAARAVAIESNGSFKIDAPMKPGKYTAFLTPKTMADPDHPSPNTEFEKSVPEKYRSEANSDVSVEIKPGPNTATLAFKK